MRRWTAWDWIGYGCLGIAAFGLAIGAIWRDNPAVFKDWPAVLVSPNWSFVPAGLFILGTLILIARAIFLPSAHDGEQVVSGPAPEVAVSAPRKLELSPSEKDRLSRVIYQLSEIIQKQGAPISTSVQGIISANRSRSPPTLDRKKQFVEIGRKLIAFGDELQGLIARNNYDREHIEWILSGKDDAIGDLRRQSSTYTQIIDQVAKVVQPGPASQILDLCDGPVLMAAIALGRWIKDCDQRITELRSSLN